MIMTSVSIHTNTPYIAVESMCFPAQDKYIVETQDGIKWACTILGFAGVDSLLSVKKCQPNEDIQCLFSVIESFLYQRYFHFLDCCLAPISYVRQRAKRQYVRVNVWLPIAGQGCYLGQDSMLGTQIFTSKKQLLTEKLPVMNRPRILGAKGLPMNKHLWLGFPLRIAGRADKDFI